MDNRSYRLGVDVGGTFTDFVLFDEATQALLSHKEPSTPANPEQAILAGLQHLALQGYSLEQLTFFSHGTTVGTNTLLQMNGARVGLLVTEGCKGVLDVGTQARPFSEMFNIFYSRPEPLVRNRFIREVPERLDYRGRVIRPLDEEAVRAAVRDLRQRGADSFAVCFLFSFMNPAHEQRAREIIQEEAPGIEVSLSCEVLPKIREYVRLSTTVMEAYLRPTLAAYLGDLEQSLNTFGVTAVPFIMQSNGGIMTLSAIKRAAARTLLSGLAAGVAAGNYIGRQCGLANLITLDVGGTSTDIAVIQDNTPLVTTEGTIARREIGLPVIDLHTLGAGGGSIAWRDKGGRISVGPLSAGAQPGPACYGLGGSEPTVTDANLLLSYINPATFAGGSLPIDPSLAEQAIARLSQAAGLDTVRMADGIVQIVNANIEMGIRLVSIDRGFDPRDFVLVAFGGAGPIHAGRVARALEIPIVLVPPYPGNTSALGLLVSDAKHDRSVSKPAKFDDVSPEQIEHELAALEAEVVAEMVAEGFKRETIQPSRFIEFRYVGEGYDLPVPAPKHISSESDKATIRRRFDEIHEARYGQRAESQPLDIMGYGVEVVAAMPVPLSPPAPLDSPDPANALRGSRRAHFAELGGWVETPIYDRDLLRPGNQVVGPAIIEEPFSTTVVYPGQSARVDQRGNLMIQTKTG